MAYTICIRYIRFNAIESRKTNREARQNCNEFRFAFVKFGWHSMKMKWNWLDVENGKSNRQQRRMRLTENDTQ